MDELESQRGGYYVEPPELLARNLGAGVRLFVAAQLFFFGAFLFAYFYLRELNASNMWHPPAVKAPVGQGAAILACIAVSAAVYWLSILALRRRGEAAWRLGAGITLLLALAALGIQCYEWATLDFGPGGGGFASVFIAWTGFYAAVGLLGGIYWIETTLATSVRHRGRKPGPVVAAAEAPGGASGARAVLVPSAEAAGVNWYFLALVEVVTFVLLYIVT